MAASLDKSTLSQDRVDLVDDDEIQSQVDLKQMTRKIDFRLLPLLFFCYTLQFMDKLALSAGSVFGIKSILEGNQYSNISSIFYVGYIISQPVVVRLIQIFPPSKLLTCSVFFWGIILMSSSGITKSPYASFMVSRLCLGFVEGFTGPIMMYYSGAFYSKAQQPLRVAIWFSGNDFGGILSGFIAYGLGHIRNGYFSAPWCYIFLVYGAMTTAWSILIFFFLPDTPENSKFLTSEEKEYFRLYRNQSKIERKWDWNVLVESLLDIKTWLFACLVCFNILPNGGILSFGFIIIESFGFSSIQTALLNVPTSVVTWVAIVLTGFLSSHLKNARCNVIASSVILPIIGAALIYSIREKGVRLFGYFLLCVQPCTFPNVLALVSSNTKTTQKNTVMAAIIFVVYCCMNIAAPQLFKEDEAPKYHTAFRTWFSCFALTVVFSQITRFYLYRQNKPKVHTASEDTADDTPDHQDPTFLYSY
ncbi:putative permease [Hyphopichia burtonii NRRL Y-1933]|uniref:Putative permease n=1 Tax=Hyphopichia burtonii NRRL Y-1933 TaxID=984485 RepID=A0A1E4RPE9_9ASCO|nr:putative permease [Hyphopichia burtonii NRRL Y-1933]ODV69118.1 putative permease [Hyphopichia burtonii NRRL Y-1933]